MELKTGKAGENVLQRSVHKRIDAVRNRGNQRGAARGADCALFAWEGTEHPVAVTADPITLRTRFGGRLAVTAALNDLAAAGAAPGAVETVILLPPGEREETLRSLMDQIREECAAQGVEVLGGHTEVTAAVTRPVVIATGLGHWPKRIGADREQEESREKRRGLPPGGEREMAEPAEPARTKELSSAAGCGIVCTKWVGMEGTFLLATERREELKAHFPLALIEEAAACGDYLSVLPEAAAAGESGVRLMHDVSEGGIFAALWTLARQTGTGLEIDLTAIPIRQVTVELCNFYDINPYQMESAGSLLLVTEDAEGLIRELERRNIAASLIGCCTEGNDKILRNGDEIRYLDLPQPEALLGILG